MIVNKLNESYWHSTAPLLRGMDKVVITPRGKDPPPMGIPFEESPESRKRRMKTQEKFVVDLTSTYRYYLLRFHIFVRKKHFSKKSHQPIVLAVSVWIRLILISVHGVLSECLWWRRWIWGDYRYQCYPSVLLDQYLTHPIPDLSRNIVGDYGIRLVAYEMPTAAAKISDSKHPTKDVKYVFNLGITSIDPSTYEDYDDSQIMLGEDSRDVVKILQASGSYYEEQM